LLRIAEARSGSILIGGSPRGRRVVPNTSSIFVLMLVRSAPSKRQRCGRKAGLASATLDERQSLRTLRRESREAMPREQQRVLPVTPRPQLTWLITRSDRRCTVSKRRKQAPAQAKRSEAGSFGGFRPLFVRSSFQLWNNG
jgi:hypothetical protein